MVIDGADGIGGLMVRDLEPVQNTGKYELKVEILNDSSAGFLNENCGAEHVHKIRTWPRNAVGKFCEKWISFDGDADRIVYYFGNPSKGENLSIIDGDKIACVLYTYIHEALITAGVKDGLNIGVIQTGYANSASTKYLQSLGATVIGVPTGVKNMHFKAAKFDIGVYFEANGHGTVLTDFSKVSNYLQEHANDTGMELLHFLKLTNEAVGDAMADFLMMETVLRKKGWSLKDVDNLYHDYPNVMITVHVEKKERFVTDPEDERILHEPASLYTEIEDLVKLYENARSFVRPSGTEDILRVYAEGNTIEEAREITEKVKEIILTKYAKA
jgi:phosphoacetylglucosamine mutase